jgi:hypothetical protein
VYFGYPQAHEDYAEPNNVVIAEGMRKLLGNLFELEDFVATDLKASPGRCERGLHSVYRRSCRIRDARVSRRRPIVTALKGPNSG